MDASEIYAKRLNAMKVLTPMIGENFTFPVADGTVKICGGDQDLRTSTFYPGQPRQKRRTKKSSRRIRRSSTTPRQDSSWYDGEAKNDFWSISGDFIYRHHVDPRVKLYVPTEESFPVPLKYIDVARTTDTNFRCDVGEKY